MILNFVFGNTLRYTHVHKSAPPKTLQPQKRIELQNGIICLVFDCFAAFPEYLIRSRAENSSTL